MFHNSTSGFRKSVRCPSSDRLLAYRQKRLGSYASDIVVAHVAHCDFCSAELEFYNHFPTIPDERVQADLIPGHLYDLARAILTNKTSGLSALRTIAGHSREED
ncbi:MAG: hypothetical protein DWQ47_14500 [Acidobacteria bacterium]|nr:MAG: hypothetical protein DWQ32_01900 [Acidobacteriota bacterium]REK02722.1 MAG: hypothetical protein DWQ38_10235 [Acidobacteriota bacterium]REK13473.1 MAG: hypothetical protein DWQ43_07590 [Acidobacteriota bacterium]REK41467.1 MAG: hypothetical protein DWQ47_14500 [Acidobacteriota bacterium]